MSTETAGRSMEATCEVCGYRVIGRYPGSLSRRYNQHLLDEHGLTPNEVQR